MVGTAASAEDAHPVQVSKFIKEWEKNGVGVALREAPCEPVDLIIPENEVERINKAKGNLKRKMLAVDITAALMLDKKIKVPTAATK